VSRMCPVFLSRSTWRTWRWLTARDARGLETASEIAAQTRVTATPDPAERGTVKVRWSGSTDDRTCTATARDEATESPAW